MRVPFLLFELFLSTNLINPAFATKIEPELQKKIDAAPVGTTWDVIVLFKEDPTLLPPPPYTNPNPEESHVSAYHTMLKLKKYSEESQSKVISDIKSFNAARSSTNVGIQTTWCTNGASITSADRDLIYHLGGDDGKPEHENITMIVEDEDIEIGRGDRDGETLDLPEGLGSSDLLDKAWGIRKINAPAWWAKKYNGSGVIIGHIDSGVDINHPSVRYHWVGKVDGWRAPRLKKSDFPYESKNESHGTHTIGTVIGRGRVTSGNDSDPNYFGVGVAPGARWISCGVCNGSEIKSNATLSCRSTTMAKCLEFLYCPNDKNRCRYRPNVVSISWACPQNKTKQCLRYRRIMDPCIKALRSQNVIPVYSAGNGGNMGCGSIYDPADNEYVLGVGNIDENDVLNSQSSMGPPEWRYNGSESDARGIYKPDFVAPGTQIISTVYTGTAGKFEYAYKTGTSMAAPHMAGAIALLLSRTQTLSFDDVRKILRKSAVNNSQLRSTNPGDQCAGLPDFSAENHKFGFGRLRLPDPDSDLLKDYAENRPTRRMPPPPDFTVDSSAIPSVRPGMVGAVILMVSTAFLMNAA